MKTVFLDIDTQIDFVLPAGALAVPGAEALIPNLARLNRFAAANRIPLVSTTDAHAENDPEFAIWPPHCIAGTQSQRKVAATLVEPDRQTIFEKTLVDFGPTPEFRSLMESLDATRFVLYGVVTEYCVKSAALALLAMGKQVEIVTDAVASLDPATANAVLEEFTRLGGRLTTTQDITG